MPKTSSTRVSSRGPRQAATLEERVVSAWGKPALAALLSSGWNEPLRLDGDDVVFWVTRIDNGVNMEFPQFFDGQYWRDAPMGPERLARLLSTLSLDLENESVRRSLLSACNALVGPVIADISQARAISAIELDPRGKPRSTSAAPDVVDLFEPPHLVGRTFVFCVNTEHDPKSRGPAFMRIAVDIDTLGLTATWLCRGRGPNSR